MLNLKIKSKAALPIAIISFILAQATLISANQFQGAGIEEIIGVLGKMLFDIAHQRYAVYGINIICTALLFYQLFRVALGKVPAFKGDGGEGISGPGKSISLVMSFMTTVALFTGFKGKMPLNFLEKLPNGQGLMAILIIAALVFIAKKSNNTDGNWRAPLLWSAGIVALGYWLYRSAALLSLLILLVVMIILSYKTGAGGGYDSPYNRGEHSEKRLKRWFKGTWNILRKSGGWVYKAMADLGKIVSSINKQKIELHKAKQNTDYISSLHSYNSRTAQGLKDYLLKTGKDSDPKIIGSFLRSLIDSKEKEKESIERIEKSMTEIEDELNQEQKTLNEDSSEEEKITHKIKKFLNKSADEFKKLMKDSNRLNRAYEYLKKYSSEEKRIIQKIKRSIRKNKSIIKNQIRSLTELADNQTRYELFKKQFKNISLLEGDLDKNYNEINGFEDKIYDIINKKYSKAPQTSQLLKRLFSDIKETARDAKQKYQEKSAEEHANIEKEKTLNEATQDLKL